MTKFIFSYLRSKLFDIIVFLTGFLIVLAVFILYRINTDVVLYAFLLCTVVLTPCFIYKCVSAYKRYQKLDLLSKQSIVLQKDSLPESNDLIEMKYNEIVKQIDREKSRIESDFDIKRTDMVDYYTLWAHQIKTPISAMRLLLQSTDNAGNKELELELFKIEQYVEMVLSYLRLESDSNDFVIKEFCIDDVIKQSVKKFSKQFILKKISLNFEETGIRVITDEKWIQFVFEQIISNSLKYTKSGSISIYAENNCIYIKDTGIGIAAEDLPRVFEKGYTGYNGRIDKKSTGLGLYLCKKVIDKLNHKIEITSQVGKGTTVKMNFSREKLEIE